MSFFLPWIYIYKTLNERNTHPIVTYRKNCKKLLIANKNKIAKATPAQKETIQEIYCLGNL